MNTLGKSALILVGQRPERIFCFPYNGVKKPEINYFACKYIENVRKTYKMIDYVSSSRLITLLTDILQKVL